MEEWKEYKLGEVSQIKGGKRLPKGVNLITSPNCHPYIRVRDLGTKKTIELNTSFEYVDEETQKSISKYTVEKGDIIISIVGTIGLVAIIGDSLNNANLTENCVKIVNSNTLNREYLYYYLISKFGQDEIKNGTVGAVQAKLPIKNIQDIKVKAPSLSEQTKIASVLKSLDDKIEVNRRINDNLEQQAQALFKSWFVDFEPFRGQPFVESELGMIPEGWRVGTLGEIMNITSGKRPPKKETKPIKDFIIPLIGASDIMGYTNSVLFNEKILVIGRVGTHGVVQRFNTPCWPSDNTLVIKSSFYEYCYQILCSIDYKRLNRGSTQPLITQTDITNQLIVIPPIEVISNFEVIVSTLMNLEIINVDESRRLAELRDTLLPRLMSGEIKVGDVTL